MKKLFPLVLAVALVFAIASACAQSMAPVKPGELELAQKVLSLQRWASAVDAQLDDAASSTNGILASNTVYIGNASNLATSQAITGDIGITTGGVVSITSGSIVNADLSAAAAIAHTKLAAVAPGYALVGNASSQAVAVAVSGDITLATNGAVAIASGVIVNADIATNAAIAQSKLATLSIPYSLVTGGVTTNQQFLSATDTTNTFVVSNGVIVAIQ